MANGVHKQVYHVGHGAKGMVVGGGGEGIPDVGFSLLLAFKVEVEQLFMVFNGDAVDGNLGMFTVKVRVGVAQKGITALEVMREADINVAARAGVWPGVQFGESHSFEQDVGEVLSPGFLVYGLQYFGLVCIVVPGALG